VQPLFLAQWYLDAIAVAFAQRHAERKSAAVKIADAFAESHAAAQRHAGAHANAIVQWVRQPQCVGDAQPGHVTDSDAERQLEPDDESGAKLHRIGVAEQDGLDERDTEQQRGPNPEQLVNALCEWHVESLQLLHDDRLPGSDRE
jgi:hypothetical protein